MSVFKPGNTALITGGASGIGLALAAKCLASAMHVIVADRDPNTLAAAPKHATQLAESLFGGRFSAETATAATSGTTAAADGGSIKTYQMDVAKAEDWAALKSAVSTGGFLDGRINLLVLNAGVGGASPWTDVAAFRRIFDVNLWGVVQGIATLLPVVQATAASNTNAATATSVVITGSKQGITNPPGTSPAYNASKAAVRSLAEQLDFDLTKQAQAGQPKTSVHLLVPGWTFTGLSGNNPIKQHAEEHAAQRPQKPAGAWWPEQVVDYLVDAMAADRFYVICPDNDVSEVVDRKRILWSAGDVAEGRAPLSRWRAEYKDTVDAWMKE